MVIVLSHSTMQDDWRSSCPMSPCKWQKKQLKQETCSPRKQQCMDQNVKHNCRLLSVETCSRSINLFYESVVHCWKSITSIQLNPTLHDLLWFMHWSSLHRHRLLNSFQHLMSSKRIICWVFYIYGWWRSSWSPKQCIQHPSGQNQIIGILAVPATSHQLSEISGNSIHLQAIT